MEEVLLMVKTYDVLNDNASCYCTIIDPLDNVSKSLYFAENFFDLVTSPPYQTVISEKQLKLYVSESDNVTIYNRLSPPKETSFDKVTVHDKSQDLCQNIYTIDNTSFALSNYDELYLSGDFENKVTSHCSSQSRFHNLSQAGEADFDNNHNAICTNPKNEKPFVGDTKTVGFGRKSCTETVFYDNSFDPRLAFNGLCDWNKSNRSREFSFKKLPSNNFGKADVSQFDNFLKDYQQYVSSLHEHEHYNHCLHNHNLDAEKQLEKLIKADLIDTPTQEEKTLAKKIFNKHVKKIWPKHENLRKWKAAEAIKYTAVSLSTESHAGVIFGSKASVTPTVTSTPFYFQPCPESWRRKLRLPYNQINLGAENRNKNTKGQTAIDTSFAIALQSSNVKSNFTDHKHLRKTWWLDKTQDIIRNSINTRLKEISAVTEKSETTQECHYTTSSENHRLPEGTNYLSEESPGGHSSAPVTSTTQTLNTTPQTRQEHSDYTDAGHCCPLPLKQSALYHTRCCASTVTTHTTSSPRFSVGLQDNDGLDKNVHPNKPSVVSAHQTPQGRTQNVNIQQLFQAAQAGCHTVIARGMLPYTCFFNQRPTYIHPNPPVIWQPYFSSQTDVRKSSVFFNNRPTEVPQTTSSNVMTSTPALITTSSHENRTSTASHSQSPLTWAAKEEKRRQNVDANEYILDFSNQPAASTANRPGSLCIPVAFNIARPAAAQMAPPIAPTCYTQRPTIQIALGNNQPAPAQFSAPFPTMYRANYCNVKNVNKNNSGTVCTIETDGGLPDEIGADDRSVMLHNVPELCAPITIHPSLSSLQANIIQIFPTKIVYN